MPGLAGSRRFAEFIRVRVCHGGVLAGSSSTSRYHEQLNTGTAMVRRTAMECTLLDRQGSSENTCTHGRYSRLLSLPPTQPNASHLPQPLGSGSSVSRGGSVVHRGVPPCNKIISCHFQQVVRGGKGVHSDHARCPACAGTSAQSRIHAISRRRAPCPKKSPTHHASRFPKV